MILNIPGEKTQQQQPFSTLKLKKQQPQNQNKTTFSAFILRSVQCTKQLHKLFLHNYLECHELASKMEGIRFSAEITEIQQLTK